MRSILHPLTRAIVAHHLRPTNPMTRMVLLLGIGCVAVVSLFLIVVYFGFPGGVAELSPSIFGARVALAALALLGAVVGSFIPWPGSAFELRLPFSRVRIFRSHWWIGFGGWLAGLLLGVAVALLIGASPGELLEGTASATGALIVPSLFGYGTWRISQGGAATALLIAVGVFGCATCMVLPFFVPGVTLLCGSIAVVISALLYVFGWRGAKVYEPGIAELEAIPPPAATEANPGSSLFVLPHRWLAKWSTFWTVLSVSILLATWPAGSAWWSGANGVVIFSIMAAAVPGVLLLVAIGRLKSLLSLAPIALDRHRIAQRCLATYGLSLAGIVLAGTGVTVLGSPEDALAVLGQRSTFVLAVAVIVFLLLWIETPGRWRSRRLSRRRRDWSTIRTLGGSLLLMALILAQELIGRGDVEAGMAAPSTAFAISGGMQEDAWIVSAVLFVLAADLAILVLKNIRYATPPGGTGGGKT